MAELTIRLQKYIGESTFNWDTYEFELATSAADVRMAVEWAQLDGVQVDSILLEIGTCFGGSTWEGREIYKYLEGLGLPIRTRILGFAASMATILMLVGDECEIDAAAQLLVHGPSGGTEGTVTQMQSGLQMLTNEHAALRDIYVARTGQPVEVVEEWMSKDTFFTAAEALVAGLVTKVLPIAPKAAPALTDAQASARRAKYAGIVARAARRPARATAPRPRTKAKNVARPAASISPRPIATITKKAAPKAGTPSRSSLTAAQKTAAQAIQALAKQAGIKASIEGLDTPTAEAVGTVLADGAGTLYTDGELAQGSEVFNDEALTEPTADAEYEAEDGRIITVADGIVSSIVEGEAEAATDSTAAITAALAPLIARIDQMEASFKAAVPPTPRARGVQPNTPDAKQTPAPRGKSLLKGASQQG